jgi:putative membrane protein
MRVSPRGLFLALVGAQLAYPRAPEGAETAATHGIIGLLLATSVADAVQERGPARAAGTLGSAAALGYGAELVGVATGKPFGHYHYGPKLGPGGAGCRGPSGRPGR